MRAALYLLDQGQPASDFDGPSFPLPPRSTLVLRHLDVYPGRNRFLIRAGKPISPWQRRREYEDSIYMNVAGVGNLDKRFDLIITEQPFLEEQR